MNIKDFLIDNYIWIIAIILITIITIIGFLADKKKNGNKNDSQQPPANSTNEMNNQGTIQNQDNSQMMNYEMNQQPNMTMPQNDMNNMNQMAPQTKSMMPESTQPTVVETMNNPQPVENIVTPVEQEPMYQPLSEQKPLIAPKPVPNYPNFQQQAMPAQPISPPQMNTNINNMQQVPVGGMTTPQPNVAQPSMTTPQTSAMPPYSIPTPMPTSNNVAPSNIIQTSKPIMPESMQPTTMTSMNSQQPINNMQFPGQVIPQQVVPQHIMTQPTSSMSTYNAGPQMQPNMANPMPQQPMPTTNQTPVNPTPVNFVFGPQNNNQNM